MEAFTALSHFLQPQELHATMNCLLQQLQENIKSLGMLEKIKSGYDTAANKINKTTFL